MPSTTAHPVVFVGVAALDAIALVDHFPDRDERQIAREVSYAGGGPAATAAVAARRLGVPAALIGAVGQDAEGEQIVESLRSEGVDVSGVQVVPNRRSGASVVVVDQARGTRAICTRAVPPLEIPTEGRAGELLSEATWVHVDHLGWGPATAWLPRGGSEGQPRLSVDAGNPITGFTPAGVDLFVPTEEALVREYGEQPLHDLLAAAIRGGARTVVATRGGKGCVAATDDGVQLEAQGHRVDVLSTLGAGDVFHGALLAAIVRGMPLRDSMRYANVTAALSCRGLDGRSAIPNHDDVLAAMHTNPPSVSVSDRSED
jgi:sulfofructose kinase